MKSFVYVTLAVAALVATEASPQRGPALNRGPGLNPAPGVLGDLLTIARCSFPQGCPDGGFGTTGLSSRGKREAEPGLIEDLVQDAVQDAYVIANHDRIAQGGRGFGNPNHIYTNGNRGKREAEAGLIEDFVQDAYVIANHDRIAQGGRGFGNPNHRYTFGNRGKREAEPSYVAYNAYDEPSYGGYNGYNYGYGINHQGGYHGHGGHSYVHETRHNTHKRSAQRGLGLNPAPGVFGGLLTIARCSFPQGCPDGGFGTTGTSIRG